CRAWRRQELPDWQAGPKLSGTNLIRVSVNPILETESRNSKLVGMARNFKDLTVRDLLAQTFSLEEEDGRVYADVGGGVGERNPETAKLSDDMGAEESGHRVPLIE